MKLKKSVHMADAAHQMSNAAAAYPTTRWSDTLKRYAKKWHITSTLIHTAPNGIKQNFYLDNTGAYVVQTAWYGNETDYPVIGKVTHTNEQPEIEW